MICIYLYTLLDATRNSSVLNRALDALKRPYWTKKSVVCKNPGHPLIKIGKLFCFKYHRNYPPSQDFYQPGFEEQ